LGLKSDWKGGIFWGQYIQFFEFLIEQYHSNNTGGKFALGVNSRMPHNRMNAKKERNTSHCRDANIRSDTNISGKKRNRRNVNNRRTPATAEKLIAA
jgi:hypothetical protein